MLSINNTTEGYLKNVEIKGNTIQDNLGVGDLADIKSVGDKVEGQELYEIPLLCTGKNLNSGLVVGTISNDGVETDNSTHMRSGKFIKVDINNISVSTNSNGYIVIIEYDKNKNKIATFNVGTSNRPNITLSKNTKYIKIRYEKNDSPNIQIEYGSFISSYEPYQENKLTILSPVQIEKVGTVQDVIYENGDIDKNVSTVVLTGSEVWGIDSTANQSDVNYFYTTVNDLPNTGTGKMIMSTHSKFSHAITNEEHCYGGSNGRLYLVTNKSKANTVDEFKLLLKSKNVVVKYPGNSIKLELPHSQQVKLRTFANKTNISFLCDVEGTIKADVPKSLGATVNTHTTQIDSLNQELERVKRLEESTVSTVTTESDFTVVEQTSNGYFEDVELKGRTLVNLASIDSSSSNALKKFSIENARNRTFTFILPNLSSHKSCFTSDTSGGSALPGYGYEIFSNRNIFKYTLTNGDVLTLNIRNIVDGTNVELDATKILILEGDHTQNPPSYFEGLASVGDGTDEIVVSTVDGGNIYDGSVIKDYRIGADGLPFQTSGHNLTDYIGVNKLKYYIINGTNNIYIATYDKDKKFLERLSNVSEFTINNNAKYIRYSQLGEFGNLCICSDKTNTSLQKTDKKRLLYLDPTDNTWKKPILDEFSTVKKGSDGIYRYYKHGEKLVLNGSESSWSLHSTVAQSDNIAFSIPVELIKTVDKVETISSHMCDRFKTITQFDLYNRDVEGCSVSTTPAFRIKIAKSKLTTQDVAGFKAWLQANNVTVVYQLATEKVYECTNIDLITYENETNFNVKSGVLSPRTTLKVHSNISNVVSLLQKKVSLLESNMSKYMITQNRLMLDSRYSADSVTFKVDYPSMVNEKITELDYDLFNLLKANVLVGKDNYNYEKMINKIDFYQSIGMIDWDMWDEIWLIMEFQHNPPVEEIPEETPEI